VKTLISVRLLSAQASRRKPGYLEEVLRSSIATDDPNFRSMEVSDFRRIAAIYAPESERAPIQSQDPAFREAIARQESTYRCRGCGD
jgi:hypothetical protein